jgi:hypothetical protein
MTVQKKNIFGGNPHFEWGSFVQLATFTRIFFYNAFLVISKKQSKLIPSNSRWPTLSKNAII